MDIATLPGNSANKTRLMILNSLFSQIKIKVITLFLILLIRQQSKYRDSSEHYRYEFGLLVTFTLIIKFPNRLNDRKIIACSDLCDYLITISSTAYIVDVLFRIAPFACDNSGNRILYTRCYKQYSYVHQTLAV